MPDPDLTPRPALYPSAPILDHAAIAAVPRIAIVLRTRDRPIFLPRALASIAGQSWPHWRILIINDGGDPAPVEAALADFGPALAGRVTVTHLSERHGMARTVNIALRDATEDLFVVHDDDDSWEPDYLTATAAFLSDPANAGFAAVGTGCTLIEERLVGERIETVRHHLWPHGRGTVDFRRAIVDLQLPPIALTFRRAVVTLVGGQNEGLTYAADLEILHRILLLGDIGFIDRPLANYHLRQRGTAGTAGNSVVEEVAAQQEQFLRLRNGMLRAALGPRPELMGLLQALLQTMDEDRRAFDRLLAEQAARLAASIEGVSAHAAMLPDLAEQQASQRDQIALLLSQQAAQGALLQAIAARQAEPPPPGLLERAWQRMLPARRRVARWCGRPCE